MFPVFCFAQDHVIWHILEIPFVPSTHSTHVMMWPENLISNNVFQIQITKYLPNYSLINREFLTYLIIFKLAVRQKILFTHLDFWLE
jgi:hypothetical protein